MSRRNLTRALWAPAEAVAGGAVLWLLLSHIH